MVLDDRVVSVSRYGYLMGLTSGDGTVRDTYRLRVGGAPARLLSAEWDRCRWVWNQCVEASEAAHRESIASGVKVQCGPAHKALSPRQRRGMPRFKAKHRSLPSLNYTLRGFGLDGKLVKLAGGARDKNSARVILNRAGFTPAGADGIRPQRSPSEQAA